MNEQEKERTIHSLQMLEQNLQQILLQKQAFQIELRETQTARKELAKSGEDVFKIIGQLMIKSTKEKIVEELKNKEKLLEIRLKTLEKQELSLSDQLEGVRDEILSQKKPEKKK